MRNRIVRAATVKAASCDAVIEQAVMLEAAVFGEKFSNTREQLAEEYGPLWPQTWFLTCHLDDALVGVARLVVPGQVRQKSLADAAKPPFEVIVDEGLAQIGVASGEVLDVVTIAIDKQYRGEGLLWPMLEQIYYLAVENHCSHIIAIIDVRVLEYIRSLGLDVKILPGGKPAPYLGSSQSVPIVAALDGGNLIAVRAGSHSGSPSTKATWGRKV